MVSLVCERCGEGFETYACWAKRGGKYCGKACAHAARKGRPSYERTPEHREAMRAIFKGRPAIPHAVEAAANARRGVKPSDKARKVAQERWTGEGNPNWQGGKKWIYAPGFGKAVRDAVIERDGVCADCGEWDMRPRGMHVHHIDGGRTNHSLDNLVLLCLACHQRRHAKYRSQQRAA